MYFRRLLRTEVVQSPLGVVHTAQNLAIELEDPCG
jgi:hypothetical protein